VIVAMAGGRAAPAATVLRLRVVRALVAIAILFSDGIGLQSHVCMPQLRSAAADEARPNLYVYLHTDAKSANLESGLKEKLRALNVTVFGRFRDFEEAMTNSRPDALLGARALVNSQNLPLALQGMRGLHDWEPWALVSVGAPLAGPLGGKVIGVVDLLGRRGTQDFVADLLKTPDIKLKRVTKLEDLLPLLQFAAADAVLIPSSEVKAVTEHSQLSLQVRELPEGKVGLAAVGVLNPKVRDLIVKQIQALDPETNKVLGVDRWRAP
jgi:hypothetical protein